MRTKHNLNVWGLLMCLCVCIVNYCMKTGIVFIKPLLILFLLANNLKGNTSLFHLGSSFGNFHSAVAGPGLGGLAVSQSS